MHYLNAKFMKAKIIKFKYYAAVQYSIDQNNICTEYLYFLCSCIIVLFVPTSRKWYVPY